jgi:hypothetical protein
MCHLMPGSVVIVGICVGLYKLYAWLYLCEEREYYRQQRKQ